METLILAFAVAMAVVALVLYFELKNTQERVERIRAEMEVKMSTTLRSALGNTTEKIPEIEHRLDDLTQKVERTEAEVHSIQKQPTDKV
jgi:signal transduction histidine kinase